MTIILAAAIAVICIVVVSLPFAQKNQWLHRRDEDKRSIEQSHNRLVIYEEISTLRREYDLGEIAGQEYHDRLDSLRLQAAILLRGETEQTQLIDALDQSIEEQIRQVRTELNEQEDMICPNCSRSLPTPTDACAECGAPITMERSEK